MTPDTPPTLHVAVIQAAPALFDREATLRKTPTLAQEAAAQGAQLALFPEAFVPAYPQDMNLENAVGTTNIAKRGLIWLHNGSIIQRRHKLN